jgi:hypothetical protein
MNTQVNPLRLGHLSHLCLARLFHPDIPSKLFYLHITHMSNETSTYLNARRSYFSLQSCHSLDFTTWDSSIDWRSYRQLPVCQALLDRLSLHDTRVDQASRYVPSRFTVANIFYSRISSYFCSWWTWWTHHDNMSWIEINFLYQASFTFSTAITLKYRSQ